METYAHHLKRPVLKDSKLDIYMNDKGLTDTERENKFRAA